MDAVKLVDELRHYNSRFKIDCITRAADALEAQSNELSAVKDAAGKLFADFIRVSKERAELIDVLTLFANPYSIETRARAILAKMGVKLP